MLPPVASRFLAGTTAPEALERARVLHGEGIGAILNLLGEHHERRELADADTEAYIELLSDTADTADSVCVSVKPTQLGLDIGESVFEANLDRILSAAAADQFVWIDMEDHTTTDATLSAFETRVTEHPNVGVCLQSNLRRTRDDLRRLAPLPGKVRLVKGAYDEPESIAYRGKSRIDEAYRTDLEVAFRNFDGGIAVGSHDPAMIDHARRLHEEYGTDYEIQMLMGVREDAQRRLAGEVPVYQYVPYGDRWLSYFYRRVRERKENALFALRAVAGV
ncbi:MAG: proline dehydrogenase family protein [Natronomonas sp.]